MPVLAHLDSLRLTRERWQGHLHFDGGKDFVDILRWGDTIVILDAAKSATADSRLGKGRV